MMKKLISLPYIYPLCPLSFNHAKMFVAADVLSRFNKIKGSEVLLPIASHFSGNTAQKISNAFERIFSKKRQDGDEKILRFYKKMYKTPYDILRIFVDPQKLLSYYTQEIFWELKSLSIGWDFKYSYSTNHEDFPIFVNTIISRYEDKGFLVKNKKGELAVDYDDAAWKNKLFDLIEKTEFKQAYFKNIIISAVNNIRSDWGLLRTTGFGVKYKNKWIIDPMFDSELFTLFDLYFYLKNKLNINDFDREDFFDNLFDVLESGKPSDNKLINAILDHLPCDIFVCEEHLKNWVVKKLYAESLLLHPKYRTKAYQFLGMGSLEGKKMSASRGHAIFAKDLIEEYGTFRARLIILLSGGNISKNYNYSTNLPVLAKKLIEKFNPYLTYLVSESKFSKIETNGVEIDKEIKSSFEKVDKFITDGYYRQAVIELLKKIPQNYESPSPEQSNQLVSLYRQYLGIILPGFIELFI